MTMAFGSYSQKSFSFSSCILSSSSGITIGFRLGFGGKTIGFLEWNNYDPSLKKLDDYLFFNIYVFFFIYFLNFLNIIYVKSIIIIKLTEMTLFFHQTCQKPAFPNQN